MILRLAALTFIKCSERPLPCELNGSYEAFGSRPNDQGYQCATAAIAICAQKISQTNGDVGRLQAMVATPLSSVMIVVPRHVRPQAPWNGA
jgi:hypothetical protein